MPTLVKIQRKGQITLPTRLRTLAGIAEGDLVEAQYLRGKIVITPRLSGNETTPDADLEYAPAQRRKIAARLAKAEADMTEGRTYGPFETHDVFLAALHAGVTKQRSRQTKPPTAK